MNIEDIILKLAMLSHILNSWDRTIVYSFADQLTAGSGFTEKQAALALRIIQKHSVTLSVHTGKDIDAIIENPTYAFPFRKMNNAKRLTIQPHPIYSRVVKVEFPYSDDLVKLIRMNKENLAYAQWDKVQKSWIFALTESSVQFLSDLVTHEKFDCDEDLQLLIDQHDLIFGDMEQYVPMLGLDNGVPAYKNTCATIPPLESTDMLAAIFEARRRGIHIWDDSVNTWVTDSDLHPVVKTFLRADPGGTVNVNSNIDPINCLGEIVKQSGPCLFVLPGGSELEKIQLIYEFLKTLDIAADEISVMFRLDSKVDRAFNTYVKENKLNSPISANTKIVFISSKIPKTMLQSNIKFNSVINLGFGGVHHTIRDYLVNHENSISYAIQKSQKGFNFGIM